MKFLTKSDISIGSQLGSQMSQYASLFSLSQKTKHSIVFNKEDLNIGRGIKILKPLLPQKIGRNVMILSKTVIF